MIPTDSPVYQKAFEHYLRKGTPIEVSIKMLLREQLRLTRRYMWLTSGDEKVRPSHAANDGKIFSWDSPPPTGHPGDEINCRCIAVPYTDLQDAALLAIAITPLTRARVIGSAILRAAIRRALRREETPQKPPEKPTPDLKDTRTWPTPPRQRRYKEGVPSRNKPRSRGEKSLYDEAGGEWRYDPGDKYHNPHWNYKPSGKAQEWQNISIDGLPPRK